MDGSHLPAAMAGRPRRATAATTTTTTPTAAADALSASGTRRRRRRALSDDEDEDDDADATESNDDPEYATATTAAIVRIPTTTVGPPRRSGRSAAHTIAASDSSLSDHEAAVVTADDAGAGAVRRVRVRNYNANVPSLPAVAAMPPPPLPAQQQQQLQSHLQQQLQQQHLHQYQAPLPLPAAPPVMGGSRRSTRQSAQVARSAYVEHDEDDDDDDFDSWAGGNGGASMGTDSAAGFADAELDEEEDDDDDSRLGGDVDRMDVDVVDYNPRRPAAATGAGAARGGRGGSTKGAVRGRGGRGGARRGAGRRPGSTKRADAGPPPSKRQRTSAGSAAGAARRVVNEDYDDDDDDDAALMHGNDATDDDDDDDGNTAYGGPVLAADVDGLTHAHTLFPPIPPGAVGTAFPRGTSWKVSYDAVHIPFAFFEPKQVETILAHRPLPAAETDGAAPVAQAVGESSDPAAFEFLVKYKNLSYQHREWVPASVITASSHGLQRIRRFLNKRDNGGDRDTAASVAWGDEGFNPSYLRLDRILDEGEVASHAGAETDVYYLVKWDNLPYDQATWERREDCEEWDKEIVDAFVARRAVDNFKRAYMSRPIMRPSVDAWVPYKESPEFKNGNRLREYQLEGVSWLVHCWLRNQSSIMADEMGLGKTVQSVTFLNELYVRFSTRGPFLVIAPLSTIPHWEREFRNWTDLNVIVYHGNGTARNLIVDTEFYWKDRNGKPIPGVFKFDVLITTYEMILSGSAQLRPIPWRAAILDEAHKLKNKSSKATEVLKNFYMDHRVLLTGTPLQNNIEELWALLNFLEPNRFASESGFMAEYGSLQSSADVERLQLLLKPLMLRRLKEDVETSIPMKEETVIEVELTNIQKKWYRAILERNFTMLKKGAKGRDALPSLINVVMELRKCCIHPYLLQGAEDLVLSEAGAQTHEEVYQALIQASGKLVLLDKLLRKLKAGGHKVLIFSQMTRCLDILGDYLRGQNYLYERIDGNIRGPERQAAIDRFSVPESESFVFLLCTRAGGVGINLTAADTAIIYDSDWNPQNDLQAQARCHRIGQTKPVQIYRLITRNTYEKEMFDRAGMKLGLDRAVLQKIGAQESMGFDTAGPDKLSKTEVEELLKKGAYGAMMDDAESNAFCDESIDQILERRATVIKHDNSANAGSIFSKASFVSMSNGSDLSMDDPNFWDKVAEKAQFQVPNEVESDGSLLFDEPRQRRAQAVAAQRQIQQSAADDNAGGRRRPGGFPGSSSAAGANGSGGGTPGGLASGLGGGLAGSGGATPRRRGVTMVNGMIVYQGGDLPPYHPHDDDGGGSGYSEGGEEIDPNGAESAVRWSNTERLYFERKLMVWGVWSWDRVQMSMSSRRSLNDLRAAVRDLLVFFVQRLDPRADAQAVMDLQFILQRLLQPYLMPHGHPLPYPGATPRQAAECRSFLADATPEQREVIGNKVRFMVSRFQLLKQVHDLVPNNYDVARRAIVVPPIGRPPADWWGPDEDRDMLIGVVKHGYHIFAPLRRDPTLCFAGRRYDPTTFQELQRKVQGRRGFTLSGDPMDVSGSPASAAGTAAAAGAESDTASAAPAAPPANGSGPTPANRATAAADDGEDDDETPAMTAEEEAALNAVEDQTQYLWPTKSDLGARLRKVIGALQRERVRVAKLGHTPAQTAAAVALHHQQQQREAALSIARAEAAAAYAAAELARAQRWNKRERHDFYRALTMHGTRFHQVSDDSPVEVFDWQHIRVAASLMNKPDQVLTDFLTHVIAVSRPVAEWETARTRGVQVRMPTLHLEGDEEVTVDRARKLLRRLELFDVIRGKVLPLPNLREHLTRSRRSTTLPEWWIPGDHDLALLTGISRHGIGRHEAIVMDPELPFHAIALEHQRRAAGGGPVATHSAASAPAPFPAPYPAPTSPVSPASASHGGEPADPDAMVVTGGGGAGGEHEDVALALGPGFQLVCGLVWPRENPISKRLEWLCSLVTHPAESLTADPWLVMPRGYIEPEVEWITPNGTPTAYLASVKPAPAPPITATVTAASIVSMVPSAVAAAAPPIMYNGPPVDWNWDLDAPAVALSATSTTSKSLAGAVPRVSAASRRPFRAFTGLQVVDASGPIPLPTLTQQPQVKAEPVTTSNGAGTAAAPAAPLDALAVLAEVSTALAGSLPPPPPPQMPVAIVKGEAPAWTNLAQEHTILLPHNPRTAPTVIPPGGLVPPLKIKLTFRSSSSALPTAPAAAAASAAAASAAAGENDVVMTDAHPHHPPQPFPSPFPPPFPPPTSAGAAAAAVVPVMLSLPPRQ